MANRMFGNFLQNAYVTSDMVRAKAVFAQEHGVSKFIDIDNRFDVTTPHGPGSLDLKISLAFVDHLQVELIEAVGGSEADIYKQVLPSDEFAIRFHHSCFIINGAKSEWIAFRESLNQSKKIVAFEAELGPVNFCYVDTRKTTGHYCEYLWSSEDIQSFVPKN